MGKRAPLSPVTKVLIASLSFPQTKVLHRVVSKQVPFFFGMLKTTLASFPAADAVGASLRLTQGATMVLRRIRSGHSFPTLAVVRVAEPLRLLAFPVASLNYFIAKRPACSLEGVASSWIGIMSEEWNFVFRQRLVNILLLDHVWHRPVEAFCVLWP